MKNAARFYSSLALMILLNILVKPAWIFGIDRQVQNQVGTNDYGRYFSLFNLSVIFIFLLDWGITNFFNRQLSLKDSRFNPGSFFPLKILFSLLYAAVLCFAAWVTGVRDWSLVACLILMQVFYSLFMFLRSALTAHQHFATDAWLSVTDKFLMLASAGLLLYYPSFRGSMTVLRFAGLQAACMGVAVLAAFFCLRQKKILYLFRFSGFPARTVFRQAFPYALIFLLMSLHARSDAFLLERLNENGAYEAGIYAAAYRLLDAANMLGALVAAFLLPYLAKRWSSGQQIGDILLPSRHFLLMGAIGLSCVMIFMGDWIQQMLYHKEDPDSLAVLQWCMPALIGYSLTQIYGTLLTATGHVRTFCLIAGVAAFSNILLNLLLQPSLGAKGSCLAALVTQLGCGITLMIYARQKLKVHLHSRSLLVYTFTAALLSMILFLGNRLPVNKILLLAIAAASTLLIMLLTGLIRSSDWRRQENELF